jgi:hypothetical protein
MLNRTEPAVWKEHFSLIAGHLVVSLMMVCLMATFAQVGERLSPNWQGEVLIWIGFLVSVESMVSHRTRRTSITLSPEWIGYRLAEWVILLVLIKLALYLAHGFDDLFRDLRLWQEDFFGTFFTGEYLGAVFISFFVWLISAIFSEQLADLEDDERLARLAGPYGAVPSRSQIRRRMADLILLLGAIIIFFTALLQIDWQVSWLGPPRQGAFYNLLAYFLLSLVLLSLTQFAILRTGWRSERIKFSREIARRWAFYSLIFLAAVVIRAGLLPTRYSIGLLELIGYGLDVLMGLLSWLGILLTLPFILLFRLLSGLFTSEEAVETEMPLPQFPIQPPETGTGAPVPLLEILKSLAFWIVLGAVIIFALRNYFAEHEELIGQLRRWKGVRWLMEAWAGLWTWLTGRYRQAGSAVRAGMARLRRSVVLNPTNGRVGFVNPRRLDPRRQVWFFYGALLRRGRERGMPRRPAQTPYEYSEDLQAGISNLEEDPKARDDVRQLTDQFIEARYSRHTITQTYAGLARQAWEHLRRVLKARPPASD